MLEEMIETLSGGFGWGVGGAAAAVALLLGAPRIKPVAKGAIKGYLAMSQRAREVAAEATESLHDIYAEARHEYESELTAAARGEPPGAIR